MNPKSVKYLSAISLNERVQFLKLLLRWNGSVWKLLWADFVWFIGAYICVTLLYQLYLINDPVHKARFEAVVKYMNRVSALVPLSFLLGFFVSTVLGRWWAIVNSIPWMTKPAFSIQALITEGDKEKCRDLRVTFIRYMNISWILATMNLSQKIKDRFQVQKNQEKKTSCFNNVKPFNPRTVSIREKMEKINSDAVVKKYFGKLIMDEEISTFENYEKVSRKPSYLIPLMWCTKLSQRALKGGYFKDGIYTQLVGIVQTFGSNIESLSIYNEFNVPLVYTQVIVIVVYVFLLSEIFSQQIITIDKTNYMETYFPLFIIFKFLIYMGWFKVGLCFINPFGNQQSDLPLDKILDYNLEVSSIIPPADDACFPDYLADSFDDSQIDRFEIFKKFRSFLPINPNDHFDLDPNSKYIEMEAFSTPAE